jgi:hypothetical protein
VVVSSETPLMFGAICLANQPGFSFRRFLIEAKKYRSLLRARLVEISEVRPLGLRAETMDIHGGVAAIVEDHVGGAAVGHSKMLVGVVPVFFQLSPLTANTGVPAFGDRGGGVVLRREDVARGPAHVGAERASASRSARRSGSSCAASRRCARPSAAASGRIPRGWPSGPAFRFRRCAAGRPDRPYRSSKTQPAPHRTSTPWQPPTHRPEFS